MHRLLPAFVLVLMAPLVAELLAGSTPLSQPTVLVILLPLYLLLYGAGALLIRELVRRSRRGWTSFTVSLGHPATVLGLAACAGAAVEHTAYRWSNHLAAASLAYAQTTADRIGLALLGLAMMGWLTWLAFRIRRRSFSQDRSVNKREEALPVSNS